MGKSIAKKTPYFRNLNGTHRVQYGRRRDKWARENSLKRIGIPFDPVSITLDSIKWKIKSNHIDKGNEKLQNSSIS